MKNVYDVLPQAVSLDAISDIADAAPGPEKMAEFRELIAQAFAVLSPREQRILRAVSEGASEKEIALEEKTTANAVKQVAKRSRAKIKKALGL